MFRPRLRELLNGNEDALKWIREGIHRNANSHEGTEWLHTLILETKIKAAGDPEYYAHHSVLNLDRSQALGDNQTVMVGGEKKTLTEVTTALRYQPVGEVTDFDLDCWSASFGEPMYLLLRRAAESPLAVLSASGATQS